MRPNNFGLSCRAAEAALKRPELRMQRATSDDHNPSAPPRAAHKGYLGCPRSDLIASASPSEFCRNARGSIANLEFAIVSRPDIIHYESMQDHTSQRGSLKPLATPSFLSIQRSFVRPAWAWGRLFSEVALGVLTSRAVNRERCLM